MKTTMVPPALVNINFATTRREIKKTGNPLLVSLSIICPLKFNFCGQRPRASAGIARLSRHCECLSQTLTNAGGLLFGNPRSAIFGISGRELWTCHNGGSSERHPLPAGGTAAKKNKLTATMLLACLSIICPLKFIFLQAAPAGISGRGSLERPLRLVLSPRPLMPNAALRGVPKRRPRRQGSHSPSNKPTAAEPAT
ncbi:MAG: hypothetical protein MPJ79_01565 [Alphaproteobacteria bacterium]|nr:hypothetical protein [Alphaproteobacteria bacterium]